MLIFSENWLNTVIMWIVAPNGDDKDGRPEVRDLSLATAYIQNPLIRMIIELQ